MAKKILLADDSTTIRRVVELTFCDTEFRVESVTTGSEALVRFATLEPDLVLADIGMEEPSGYEICRRIKDSDRPVPVVLLAGTFEPFDEGRAAACGADGHVIKPFDSAVLVRQVQQLIREWEERGKPPDPAAETASAGEPAESGGDPVQEALEEFTSLARQGEFSTGEPTALELHETELHDTAAGPEAGQARAPLTAAELDAIARAVVERLAGDALREIAWEVVPQLAETIIRERIRQLEREIED